MSKLKNKNKIKRIVYSWPILILLLIIVILLGKSVWGVWQNEKVSNNNKELSENAYNKLENKNNFLLSEIETLETEKGIETEIREKFRVVKEGEQLAVIINSVDSGEKDVEVEKEGLWRKIWNFLRD